MSPRTRIKKELIYYVTVIPFIVQSKISKMEKQCLMTFYFNLSKRQVMLVHHNSNNAKKTNESEIESVESTLYKADGITSLYDFNRVEVLLLETSCHFGSSDFNKFTCNF
ncbi:MAG: hypothetical protein EXX96DRAFT_551281 [Benjaminiella poitrasii]|nr:MAG: hypothetical protein EXX96DRAFT_551281 [Benjaminiella poitrasii]